jgi:hypothetical protein
LITFEQNFCSLFSVKALKKVFVNKTLKFFKKTKYRKFGKTLKTGHFMLVVCPSVVGVRTFSSLWRPTIRALFNQVQTLGLRLSVATVLPRFSRNNCDTHGGLSLRKGVLKLTNAVNKTRSKNIFF